MVYLFFNKIIAPPSLILKIIIVDKNINYCSKCIVEHKVDVLKKKIDERKKNPNKTNVLFSDNKITFSKLK